MWLEGWSATPGPGALAHTGLRHTIERYIGELQPPDPGRRRVATITRRAFVDRDDLR